MKLKPLVAALGMRPEFWVTRFMLAPPHIRRDEEASHVKGFTHAVSAMGRSTSKNDRFIRIARKPVATPAEQFTATKQVRDMIAEACDAIDAQPVPTEDREIR